MCFRFCAGLPEIMLEKEGKLSSWMIQYKDCLSEVEAHAADAMREARPETTDNSG
jgi:hypothetical protein